MISGFFSAIAKNFAYFLSIILIHHTYTNCLNDSTVVVVVAGEFTPLFIRRRRIGNSVFRTRANFLREKTTKTENPSIRAKYEYYRRRRRARVLLHRRLIAHPSTAVLILSFSCFWWISCSYKCEFRSYTNVAKSN